MYSFSSSVETWEWDKYIYVEQITLKNKINIKNENEMKCVEGSWEIEKCEIIINLMHIKKYRIVTIIKLAHGAYWNEGIK
jgi:hypothetical protein